MEDKAKTKEQLLRELAQLREKIAEFEISHAELKKAEEISLERENRFRAIADYAYGWEDWFDVNGKLVWVSPAVLRITGYTAAECMAMIDYPLPLTDQEDRDRAAAYLAEAVQGVSRNDVELRIRCKDGSLKWIGASWQPMYDRNGASMGHRSSRHDITERR
ncbi:MAG TPA: hypothetical protein DCR97_03645, partial [Deltaproteobacteria bacterium]|nr:hypothetical protein [Deltaproteobacteria bacterium]